uniref:MULE transposase domain-containing protein n=1 Tax=Tanacetum cinerariifolium TaxID=118510 RepID=A0A6L2J7E8_TANCI|nr:hypothetical protein [Tanacetum cinerariifolium]
MAEVSTQEPIVAEVSTEYNGEFNESARSDGQFFFDDVGIDTKFDVQSSKDAGIDDDDHVDEDFFVDEENEIVEPDVDVHLFGISIDLPFDNIGVTNLVSNDALEGEDVDVINADGFDSDPGNDEETNYKKIRLAKLRTEMKGVINASGQWKYSFYTGQKFTAQKEAKDRVYLHFIESKRSLKLYKNDGVRIRARCVGKVLVFTMSQGTRPTGLNCGMVFQRIYVCLGALKLGFRACRRDLLGLDSAFMKGPFLVQVLVAVGLDSNNGIYLLAYALVEAESKSSWCWFLQCLGDDIDLHPNLNFTFIGNRQKCIIPAIKTVYPSAEYRYYLRNIHENMKQGWCGQAYKDLLWRAAYATSRAKFDLLLNKYYENHGIHQEAHLMKVQWNGANKHQVSGSLSDQCVVDVVSMTCSCRKWELIGIPCGNNLEASGSASRQAQQTEPSAGQDGSGGLGVGVVIICLLLMMKVVQVFPVKVHPIVDGQRVKYKQKEFVYKKTPTQPASQPSTSSQVPVSETRNTEGREIGYGVPTQSSAAGVRDNDNFPMVNEEEVTSKKLAPMAEKMIMLIEDINWTRSCADVVAFACMIEICLLKTCLRTMLCAYDCHVNIMRVATPREFVYASVKTSGDARSWCMISWDAKYGW